MSELITPEERAEGLARLRDLEKQVAQQTAALRPLAARCDAAGIEKVEWYVLVEMAARAEMLRRLHEQIALGRSLLGLDPHAPAPLS
jgi:hypothetical protein